MDKIAIFPPERAAGLGINKRYRWIGMYTYVRLSTSVASCCRQIGGGVVTDEQAYAHTPMNGIDTCYALSEALGAAGGNRRITLLSKIPPMVLNLEPTNKQPGV